MIYDQLYNQSYNIIYSYITKILNLKIQSIL